jgi:hypothetical protein
MTQSRQARANELSDFDRLVSSQVNKSVVVAPKDPNGGAKLPVRQSNAAKRKGKGKEQYMAIFDREAQESNDQLEDWEEHTNDTTESPDKFVNDDDDAPEDYDEQQWEDNRRSDDGDGVYDPFSDDDEMGDDDIESLELPDDDEEYVTVKRHKRRKNGVRKSNAAARGDMDEDFADLTNDDDDLDEGDEDEDEDERPKRKTSKKEDDGEREKSRRKEVRKALGTDAMKYVDGNPLIKALTDAVWDLKDQSSSEIRALALDVRKLHQENVALRALVQKENRQMVKSLVNGQMQIAGYDPVEQAQVPQQRAGQPMRKGFGAPIATSQRPREVEFDLAKAFEVLEAEYQKPGNDGGDPQIMNDITILDNNRTAGVAYLSNAGKAVLHKAGLI